MILLGIIYASPASHSPSSRLPRIALLGDSMTWIGGDSCRNATGWSHVLRESGIAGKIDVFARSGATWTNTNATRCNPAYYTEILHDDNVVYNQAIRLIEMADSDGSTPDIIILFAGANDAWFEARRPGIFDVEDTVEKYTLSTQPGEVTSLAGSVALVADILSERFPTTTLLFVTPIQMSKTDAGKIFHVSDIIEKTASDRGFHTLRADKETGISHEVEAKSPTYTYDGVHTNPEGARLLGGYILGFLLSYLSDPDNQSYNTSTPQLHN